eukprot:scaffold49866_cov27-Tisochrysis_lutea.AAC.1
MRRERGEGGEEGERKRWGGSAGEYAERNAMLGRRGACVCVLVVFVWLAHLPRVCLEEGREHRLLERPLEQLGRKSHPQVHFTAADKTAALFGHGAAQAVRPGGPD